MTKKANGEGSISPRKDGSYMGQAYVLMADGTYKRKTVYGKSFDETHQKLTELIAQSHKGVPLPTRTWKVGEYLDHWLEHTVKVRVRPSTYAKYENFVRLDLKPGLGKKRLDRLTPAEVRQFLNQRRAGGDSEAQLQAMHSVLRNALNDAMRDDLVMRNVASLVRAPSPKVAERQPWNAEEAKRFLVAARKHPLFAGFVLMLTLGLRKGEVLGLAWNEIDWNGWDKLCKPHGESYCQQCRMPLSQASMRLRWQIQRQKRADGSGSELVRVELKTQKSKRALPVPLMCAAALDTRRLVQQGEWVIGAGAWNPWDLVFTTGDGTPWEPRNVNRAFDTVCEKAGVRVVRVHDARHGFASLLAAEGVELSTIMALMGHSQVAVTANVYTHVPSEAKRAAIKHIDRLLGDAA
jgi:integrase